MTHPANRMHVSISAGVCRHARVGWFISAAPSRIRYGRTARRRAKVVAGSGTRSLMTSWFGGGAAEGHPPNPFTCVLQAKRGRLLLKELVSSLS